MKVQNTEKESKTRGYHTKLIQACKKERKWFRFNLEREWKMGQPALLHSLKYNSRKHVFIGAAFNFETRTGKAPWLM